MFEAARDTGMDVIWDLWHYGWPDDLDLFSSHFIDRFVRFASEVVARLSDVDPRPPRICPINEISFFSWAAGEGGIFNPFQKGRGDEVKRQLGNDGTDITPGSPEDYASLIDKDERKWAQLVKASGVEPE